MNKEKYISEKILYCPALKRAPVGEWGLDWQATYGISRIIFGCNSSTTNFDVHTRTYASRIASTPFFADSGNHGVVLGVVVASHDGGTVLSAPPVMLHDSG